MLDLLFKLILLGSKFVALNLYYEQIILNKLLVIELNIYI